jgi:phosphatidylglycerol---prolipoprotein diacylglyceryl transferase
VIPVLFKIGPITVYSFGLMMGIAFIVANYLFTKEIRRKGLPDELAGTVTLIALIGGVAGSKLFSLLENWDRLLADPMGEIFSAAGLTFYGGLILATLSIYLYVRSKKVPFLRVADAAAPSLIIAYGIGRIGCQLAGDGDYGIPSKLPWAMGYPNGTVSTLAAQNPDLARLFQTMYPGQPVPADIPVHPAPVYETLAAFAIFAFLWAIRKRPMATGMLFAIYLIAAGIERLLVEFIRLNDLYLGLSQAQWISVGMILLGSWMVTKLRSMPVEEIPPAQPATRKRTPARARA